MQMKKLIKSIGANSPPSTNTPKLLIQIILTMKLWNLLITFLWDGRNIFWFLITRLKTFPVQASLGFTISVLRNRTRLLKDFIIIEVLNGEPWMIHFRYISSSAKLTFWLIYCLYEFLFQVPVLKSDAYTWKKYPNLPVSVNTVPHL